MKIEDPELRPEDYVEPRCLLSGEPFGYSAAAVSVPQQRIMQKLDEYMSHKDFAGAERHLRYWLEEARLGNDLRGSLLIENEMIGFYRKTGAKEKAYKSIDSALELIDKLSFEDTVSAATTYVNAATAFQAFGDIDRSLGLFIKARNIYENDVKTSHDLLGGLYNNMALTYAALKDFGNAFRLYEKAIKEMENVKGGELEQAITYLNMANAAEAESSYEEAEHKIFEYLDTAWDLIKGSSAPENGYYAFVCEKCAPTFRYYGYFMAAEELTKRSERIYERD